MSEPGFGWIIVIKGMKNQLHYLLKINTNGSA